MKLRHWSASGIERVIEIFLVRPTWRTVRGDGRFSYTGATGTRMRAAIVRPFQSEIAAFGRRSFEPTENATQRRSNSCGRRATPLSSSGNASSARLRFENVCPDSFTEPRNAHHKVRQFSESSARSEENLPAEAQEVTAQSRPDCRHFER